MANQSTISYTKVEDDSMENGLHYVVYAARDKATDQPISVKQWATLLASNPTILAHDLTELITALPYQGFYFETPGVSIQTADKPFRFCIADGKRLFNFAEPRASSEAFQEHLQCQGSTYSCRFANLSGDATLVAPKKTDTTLEDKAYSHLAAFLRGAPRTQVAAVWKKVAETYLDLLETRDASHPVWLSTAGEGVPWLHFRFDSRPKYYKYGKFAKET